VLYIVLGCAWSGGARGYESGLAHLRFVEAGGLSHYLIICPSLFVFGLASFSRMRYTDYR